MRYPTYDTTVYDERKKPAGGPKLPVARHSLPGADPEKWDENGNRIKAAQFSTKAPRPLAETYKFAPTPRRERKTMAGTDKRKQSLYFPEDMLAWLEAEAERQDRSLSWIAQMCVKVAKEKIESFPGVREFTDVGGGV